MSNLYPYIHPDPFASLMRYDYADCKSDDFFVAWKKSRTEFKEKILLVEGFKKKEEPIQIEGTISLENLLEDAKNNSEKIWVLIRKYEVFGRFYSHYTHDFRKHEKAALAEVSSYITFAEILNSYAQKSDVLQFHSTFLKVMDSLCSLDPENITTAQAQKIVTLINNEQKIIEGLRS